MEEKENWQKWWKKRKIGEKNVLEFIPKKLNSIENMRAQHHPMNESD